MMKVTRLLFTLTYNQSLTCGVTEPYFLYLCFLFSDFDLGLYMIYIWLTLFTHHPNFCLFLGFDSALLIGFNLCIFLYLNNPYPGFVSIRPVHYHDCIMTMHLYFIFFHFKFGWVWFHCLYYHYYETLTLKKCTNLQIQSSWSYNISQSGKYFYD